ncbi:MAG: ribonuclease P protein component [Mangrovicoccus sp.]
MTLRQRSDFLSAAKALRRSTPAFTVQARQRAGDESGAELRVGYTCSKKVGNAVARNRAKRRLRAVARQILPIHGYSGWDYVLIGRRDVTATHPFEDLAADLTRALAKLHRK